MYENHLIFLVWRLYRSIVRFRRKALFHRLEKALIADIHEIELTQEELLFKAV